MPRKLNPVGAPDEAGCHSGSSRLKAYTPVVALVNGENAGWENATVAFFNLAQGQSGNHVVRLGYQAARVYDLDAPDPHSHSDGTERDMGFFHNLRLEWSRRRTNDPEFGVLKFVYFSSAPERAYWEGEWKFPNTDTTIAIGLPGGEAGPLPESREFYLSLPGRFDQIIAAVRPRLQEVFRHWFEEELPQDIFTVVKLGGFGLDDPRATPIHWDVGFETTGDKWLGITIPFVGDTPQEAVVDT